MSVIYYPAIFERVDDGFSVYFPDLNGCTSAGDSVEDATVNAEQALALHLSGMAEDGDPIPAATPIEVVEPDPEGTEAFRQLIRVEMPGRVMRINIIMDEGLLAAADAAAKRLGQSRSAFFAEAVRGALQAA